MVPITMATIVFGAITGAKTTIIVIVTVQAIMTEMVTGVMAIITTETMVEMAITGATITVPKIHATFVTWETKRGLLMP